MAAVAGWVAPLGGSSDRSVVKFHPKIYEYSPMFSYVPTFDVTTLPGLTVRP